MRRPRMVKDKAGRNRSVSSVYVIAGKDESLRDRKCTSLIDELLDTGERDTGLLRVRGNEAVVSDVFDELRTLPFLGSRRVVVVKGADEFISDNRSILEKYFDRPSPSGVLVLTVTSWDSRTRLAKRLPKVGRLISLQGVKRRQLPERVKAYAREAYGKKISTEAAELLVELSGEELSRLYGDVDKLSLLKLDGDRIEAVDVESLIGHNRMYNAFAVINAAVKGDAGKALELLGRMLAADKSAEYKLVGAFAYHIRKMFNAKVLMKEGFGRGQIARRLGVWSNTESFFEQVAKMSLERIGGNLEQLAEIDFEIKTGRASAQSAGERLVMSLRGDRQ